MKQKLKLTLSELRALDLYLHLKITAYSVEYLRDWWQGFCVISSLKEIYDKVHGKVEDANLFPPMPHTIYRISLTRTQAVALACTTLSTDDNEESRVLTAELVNLTFEENVIRAIVQETIKLFLV